MDQFVFLAKQAVEVYVREGKIISPPPDLPAKMLGKRAGVFVSLHKISPVVHFVSGQGKEASPSLQPPEIFDGYQPPVSREELRGCIGTYLPVQKNIAQEIIHNAIESASRDPRFPPIAPSELPQIRYSVDILSPPEPVSKIEDLDAKRYGLIVSTGDGRRGLLLPDLEGVETVEQQIEICRGKAGILSDEEITLARFTVERHGQK